MSRQRHRRWLALAAGALVSACVLVTGVLIGPAAPARAASLGTVTLSQTSGTVDANPMFTNSTTSAACPSGFGENAALRVGRPGGPYSNLAPSLGGGGFDQAPIEVGATRSFTTAIGGTAPGNGEWWVIVECFSLTAGRHADEFRTSVFVTGTDWSTQQGNNGAVTTTSLAVAPEGDVPEGDPVNLTATVTPAEAVGKVEFFRTTALGDGTNETVKLGENPVASGTATLQATLPGPAPDATPPVIEHTLTAIFRPTDANAFRESSSEGTVVRVTRGQVAKQSNTVLTVAPTGPAPSGAAVTLTAAVTINAPDVAAAGSVKFERRPNGVSGAQWTEISTVAVAGGSATHTIAAGGLPDGRYDFQATFVPTTPAEQATSADIENAYQIGEAPSGPAATTTKLDVTPENTAEETSEVTMKATVTPAGAAGTVQFRDGSTVLETATLSNGTAEYKTSALALGQHTLTAAFTPSTESAAEFQASTSSAVQYEIVTPGDDDDGDDDGDDDDGDDDDGGGGGSLASTGTPLVTIGASGLLLIGAGVGAMFLTRRRRPEPEPVAWPDER